jgi:hypothetical protein
MNNLKMIEIPENIHVTSVERHYKVKSSKIEYVIAVKSELDEEATKKLLREEDDELKILLAGSTKYEIKNVMIPTFRKKKEEEKKEEKEKEEKKEEKGKEGDKKFKWLSPEQRVEVLKELPEMFGMKDFVDKLIDKGYSEFDAKNIWKATRDALTKSKKVEIIKGRQKREMKYKYIGGD